jgi:vancomycin resistance protein VanJ
MVDSHDEGEAKMSGPPRDARRQVRRALRLIGRAVWACVLAAAFLVVLSWLVLLDLRDDSKPYLGVVAATFVAQVARFHVGLVCAVGVLAAASLRRWRLAIVALLVVSAAVLPELRTRRAGALAAGAPALRVMTLNAWGLNRDADAILRRVRAADPDVLVLQEYAPPLDGPLRDALASHPHRLLRPRDGAHGLAVFSRYAFAEPPDAELRLGPTTRHARVVIGTGGGREVVVYNVHLSPPRSLAELADNRREVADLVDAIGRDRRPVVVAGDMNFTPATAQAAALGRAGLVEAHAAAGTGRGATWPHRTMTRDVPGLRVDHVFAGHGLVAARSDVLHGCGSDHRPVVADLVWAERGTDE